MQAGKIYKMDFGFEPPEPGSKYRPALVMFVDSSSSLAYVCKITKSGPNKNYPYREKILDYAAANLHEISYVQYNWFDTVSINVKHKHMGNLRSSDFIRIFNQFRKYHGI